MRSRRLLAPLVAVGAAFTLLNPAHASADTAVATACGTPLSSNEIDAIVALSDTSTLSGTGLPRLESAIDRHHRITEILVDHRDRRGLFSIGLDAVEHEAVLPLQRDPAALPDRTWSPTISYDLLTRYLRNLHAEFTGAPVDPAWFHYFALTRQCAQSPPGSRWPATTPPHRRPRARGRHHGTRPEHVPDFYRIVDRLHSKAIRS